MLNGTKKTVQTAWIPIGDLIPLEKNPRKISADRMQILKDSLDRLPKFFEARPLLVNNATGKNIVYAGNQRLAAAKALGLKEVPCIVETLSQKEQDERTIRDNVELGDWDFDLLKEWNTKDLEAWGVEAEWVQEVELEEDGFDPEQHLPTVPKTKLGDLYQLGEHRLLCGDSTSGSDVETLMQGERGQLIFTDPPYNVDYQDSKGRKIKQDRQSDADFTEFLTKVLKNLHTHTTDDCIIYWWLATSKYPENALAFDAAGWKISQTLIWLKEHMVLSRGVDYHRCYEPCLLGWKKKQARFKNEQPKNLKDVFALSAEDYREAMDIWFERCDLTTEYQHPTQKPVRLSERALKKHSMQGWLVLDLFAGGGGSLIACEQAGRKWRGMELDPAYCDVVIKRWEQFTGGAAQLIRKNA